MKTALFGIGTQGRSSQITAKTLQNFFVEQRPIGESSQMVGIGFPGLDLFVDFGDRPCRGHIPLEQNNNLYVVHLGTLYEVNNAGVKTSRGTLLTTTGIVGMAHNGTQLMIVDGTDGYIFNKDTLAFGVIADGDFPANPISVTYQDGYFIVGFANGRFYISGINDGTAWDALDFASAESNPDTLVRIYSDHGQLILFGDISTEFWSNTGAVDFPFAKIVGADAEWGLAAKDSAAKFDGSVAFLATNRMGQVVVGRLRGYQFEKVSTPDLDHIINGYASVSDATAYSYMLDGHPMYQINFPSAGFTWNYDGLTGFWSKRKSANTTRHRAELGAQYINKTVVSDYSSGRLYRMNADTLTENGDVIEGEIVGEHIQGELERFPINRVRLDMETGSPAQVMMQLSKDSGKSWGVEKWRSTGETGEYETRVEWRRLGQARRAVFKFRITDAVKRIITGMYLNPID